MLPPKELNTQCPRCGQDLAPEARLCPACGSDREAELAIRGALDPAIASLQRWLLLVAGVTVVSTLIIYAQIHRTATHHELLVLCGPGALVTAMLLVLCAIARLVPLAASLAALGLFLANLVLTVRLTGWGVLVPGFGLAIRIILLVVLVGAVQAGWKARVLRRQSRGNFPTAVARTRTPPEHG